MQKNLSKKMKTIKKTLYWLRSKHSDIMDNVYDVKVSHKLVNQIVIEHLKDKLSEWENDGIDVEDLIHQMELQIRHIEDVREQVL